MPHTRLTGRQRFSRMLLRQDQDRIPRYETFWTETLQRWETEGLIGAAHGAAGECLGSDVHGLCWTWPAPFPGREEVVEENHETKVVVDAWGAKARFWKGRSGTPEHLGFECDSREVWEKRCKPALLAVGVQTDVAAAVRTFASAQKAQRWSCLVGVESFEAIRKLIGDEVGLMAMVEDPDWIRDISRTHTDAVLRDFQAMYDAGVHADGVWFYGDMAYNHSTMCSPDMYRELVLPDHKRLVEWAHARGMKFIYHTDGNVNDVIPMFIEAGFDCLQPLEAKAHMDVRELCPRYGDKLAFFGNINVMIMATNDLALIEEEIASKFRAGMATRGYAYHSDHSVPPLVSWQTYQGIIRLINKYGNYE